VPRLRVTGYLDSEDDPFDRQKRIDWWRQDAVARARVMVVGAGAIGNETLKNLALVGIGNIFIADFDEVSPSNLSRTLLFRKNDVGRRKAEVAAERTAELALSDIRIDWFHGDIALELGAGIFREFDIVLGCLDNVETRLKVNRYCWLAGTPWIDAGISSLAGHVSVYVPGESACYECGASREQLIASRVRYSCDDFKRSLAKKHLAPTVQISSAIASAIQVQEAVKLLCGHPVPTGKKILFDGTRTTFDVVGLPQRSGCDVHATYTPIPVDLGHEASVRELLDAATEMMSASSALDLTNEQFSFVKSIDCRKCGCEIVLNRASFRIFDYEALCQNCRGSDSQPGDHDVAVRKRFLASVSYGDHDYIDLALRDLGVPAGHVVAVADSSGEHFYIQLSADISRLLPTIGARAAHSMNL